MYRYYRNAQVCYAYLADVPFESPMSYKGGFAASRWFQRGWTLQELIAPSDVLFFAHDWQQIGAKQVLAAEISSITGVDQHILVDSSLLREASVAKRMSWASNRSTTRKEDIAYCLLGIFGVNMPLLYGEGDKAFIRLQEEIMKHSTDQSLFAWASHVEVVHGLESGDAGILAVHPRDFALSVNVVPIGINFEPYTMTNKGLRISLPVVIEHNRHIAILACRYVNNFLGRIGVVLEQINKGEFIRSPDGLEVIDETRRISAKTQSILILRDDLSPTQKEAYAWIRTLPASRYGFTHSMSSPTNTHNGWDTTTRTRVISTSSGERYSIILKHQTHPSVIITFCDYGSIQEATLDISLASQPPNDSTLIGMDRFLHMLWWRLCHEKLPSLDDQWRTETATFVPEISLTAKISWQIIWEHRVLVLDINAYNTHKEMSYITSSLIQRFFHPVKWLYCQRAGHWKRLRSIIWFIRDPIANSRYGGKFSYFIFDSAAIRFLALCFYLAIICNLGRMLEPVELMLTSYALLKSATLDHRDLDLWHSLYKVVLLYIYTIEKGPSSVIFVHSLLFFLEPLAP
jgi:hypothetical protein